MAQPKLPEKNPNDRLFEPIDILLKEDGGSLFKGESERERTLTALQFVKVRNVIQRYAQTLLPDEAEALVKVLKSYLKEEG